MTDYFRPDNTSGFTRAELRVLSDLHADAITAWRASDDFVEEVAADYAQHIGERILTAADTSAFLTGEVIASSVRAALRRIPDTRRGQ